MDSEDNNILWEAGLRRELSEEERTRLEASFQGETKSGCAEDLALNAILRRVPNLPVSSNFTHRVLESVSQPSHAKRLATPIWRTFLGGKWLPKPVWISMLIVGAVLLGGHQYQRENRRQTAQSVAKISHVEELLSVDVLKDFEAINRFGRATAPVDEELFAALN